MTQKVSIPLLSDFVFSLASPSSDLSLTTSSDHFIFHPSTLTLPQFLPFMSAHSAFYFFFILFCSSLILPVHSNFPYARCFQKLDRHSIDNSQPLTEIFRTSPLDCLEQCITHTGNGDEQEDPGYCRSVVYDQLQHSCRLYGHDGRKVPAVMHPANGFDMYRRISSIQECVGPVQRLLALNARKAAVFGPSPKKNEKTGPIPIPASGVTHSAVEESLTDEELATLLDQFEGNGAGKGGSGGHEGNIVGDERGAATASSTLLDCAANGRATGYLSYQGGHPMDGAEEFIGWTEPACAQFCTANLDPEGNAFPCAGFSHRHGGSKCQLHPKVSSKVLIQRPLEPYSGMYAEKWCVSAHRYGICRESVHFPVYPQQRFAPNCIPLVALEQIPTLTDCLAKCMDQRGCQTISFHVPSRRCFLFSQLPLASIVVPADQGWIMVQNECTLAGPEGPIGTVDSEDGEIEARGRTEEFVNRGGGGGGGAGIAGGLQREGEARVEASTPSARAFGQQNRPCAEAIGTGGGMGGGLMGLLEGGERLLSNMLFGGKR